MPKTHPNANGTLLTFHVKFVFVTETKITAKIKNLKFKIYENCAAHNNGQNDGNNNNKIC